MAAAADRAKLAPLVLATMASQALLVVLAPTMDAVGEDLAAPVPAVGQARSVTAAVAVAASVALTARVATTGVRRLLTTGAVVAVLASGAVAAAPSLSVFLAAHALVGLGLACLLTAGFAGAAAFPADRRGWALGHVAGANALAWILVNPVVGAITERASWRIAHIAPAAVAVAAALAARRVTPAGAAGGAPRLRRILAARHARRWLLAELIAYAAWTGVLTFLGAFFAARLGLGETAVGWALGAGAAAYFLTSTRSSALLAHFAVRRLVTASALAMAPLIAVLFASTSVATALSAFVLVGVAAGVRTPASSGLGLEQLPGEPGAMMAARTATVQVGYLLGAAIGGAVIAAGGYSELGLLLATTMVASAVLVLGLPDAAAAAGPTARA